VSVSVEIAKLCRGLGLHAIIDYVLMDSGRNQALRQGASAMLEDVPISVS